MIDGLVRSILTNVEKRGLSPNQQNVENRGLTPNQHLKSIARQPLLLTCEPPCNTSGDENAGQLVTTV